MKRLVFYACILLIAVSITFATVITASAHPGRTDSNGGHTDHSTGEYHYHHGYPAHSHYDIDGDGDIDCPYDFDDKTNHNKSDSNSSGESAYDRRLRELMEKYGTPTEPAATTVPETTSEEKPLGGIIVLSLVALGFLWNIIQVIAVNCLPATSQSKAKLSKENAPVMTAESRKSGYSENAYNKATCIDIRFGPKDEDFTKTKRSSFIQAVCYKEGRLYVKTTDNNYYLYYNVPRSVYQDFMNAPSLGRFFNEYISNNYPFSRL